MWHTTPKGFETIGLVDFCSKIDYTRLYALIDIDYSRGNGRFLDLQVLYMLPNVPFRKKAYFHLFLIFLEKQSP